MSKPTVSTVERDLAYLDEAWPSLVALKVPGTARAWVETPRRAGALSPEELDRMGNKGVPRPTPADLGVLDLLYCLADRADTIARTLVEVAGGKPSSHPPESASKDPRPWLSTARVWLAAAEEFDDRSVPWVAHQIRPLVQQTARLLGDIRDGQVLNGICPWCNGRTVDGVGERTVQIHYPDPDEDEDEPLIICRGVNCSPPRTMCGHRWRNHPAWARREWEWLSKMLRDPAAVEERAS